MIYVELLGLALLATAGFLTAPALGCLVAGLSCLAVSWRVNRR